MMSKFLTRSVFTVLCGIAFCNYATAFLASKAVFGSSLRRAAAVPCNLRPSSSIVMQAIMADTRPTTVSTPAAPSAAAPSDSSSDWRMEIPEPVIESEVGADYIPLLTSLKLGHYEEADQLTRDLLIFIGGEDARKRGFVYFAEAPKLPLKDMQTIDRLWVTYSKGKFGYSVQKAIWNSAAVKGDFNVFVQEIKWTNGPCGGCGPLICSGCTGTLKRWLPMGSKGNEFIYDLNKAPKGHLPLTSALRGTYLLKNILVHRAFGMDGLKSTKTGAAAAERLSTMEEMRFPPSPYSLRKAPWDV